MDFFMVKFYHGLKKNMAVNFLQVFIKPLKSISDEWFIAICWSSLLFGIFKIKECVQFSLTSLDTLKYDCVIKIRETLIFLPLIYSSVTTELCFLLLIISAIASSKTINALRFFVLDCTLQYFCRHFAYHFSFQ